MVFVAIFNGIMRGALYEQFLDSLSAHQLSSLTLVIMFAAVTWSANRRWPISSYQQAALVGVMWFILTPLFEFGFGMYVMGRPLSALLADYNLLAGRTWSLVLVATALLPPVVYYLSSRREQQ